MATIANAYVQLLPSFEGLEAKMTAGMAKPSKAAGKSAGAQVTSGIGKSLSGLGSKLSGSLGSVASGIGSKLTDGIGGALKSGAGTFASDMGALFKSGIGDLGEQLGLPLGKAFSKAGEVASKALGNVKTMAGSVGSAVSGIASKVGGAFSSMAGVAASGLSKVAGLAASTLGTVGSLALKGGAVAGAALAAGVTALGKSAVDGFAEYEQLVGGMETLFGDSATQMRLYAGEAYKTAQMSANDFMQLSTDFAASMISSVGGDTTKAAELTNSAVIDMADNANKMGSDMASIQDAYRGFSRGNYTMLDNLKLGFGGTKEEMQRLLDEAEKLTGQDYDISSFADITEAIHAIQTEMGIAGSSSEEAATTISGSVGMMKSAWSNWVTGIGRDDADMTKLTDRLMEGVTAAASNILPRLATVAANIANSLPQLIDQLGPTVSDALATLGESIDLGQLVETVTGGLVDVGASVAAYIPTVAETIAGAVPTLAEKIAAKLDESLTGGMAGRLVSFVEGIGAQIGQAFQSFTSTLDFGALGNLLGTVAGIAGSAIQSLVGAFQTAAPVIANVANAVMPALATGFQIAAGVISGVVGVVTSFGSSLLSSIGPAIETVSPYLQTLGEKAAEFGGFVTSTVLPVLGALGGMLGGVVGSAINFVAEKFDALMQFLAPVGEFFGGVADAIGGAFSGLADKLGVGVDTAATSVEAATSSAASSAEGMSSSLTSTWDQMLSGTQTSFDQLATSAGSGMDAAALAMQTGASSVETAATEAATSASTALADFGTKAATGVDTAAMDAPATTMVQNAITAAKAVDASSIGQQFSQSAAAGVDTSAMANQLNAAGAAAQALNQTSTIKVEADLTGVQQLRSAASQVQGSFRAMSSSVQASMANASRSAAAAGASVRASMNIPSKTVHINVAAGSVILPHFHMNGTFNPKTGAVPSVGVSWYAKGGIFDEPSIIGVGEKGPEAVVPIDKLADMLDLGDLRNERPVYNITINGVSGPDETARAVVRALRMSAM